MIKNKIQTEREQNIIIRTIYFLETKKCENFRSHTSHTERYLDL